MTAAHTKKNDHIFNADLFFFPFTVLRSVNMLIFTSTFVSPFFFTRRDQGAKTFFFTL